MPSEILKQIAFAIVCATEDSVDSWVGRDA
jgi:hypothetical protein